MNIKTQIQNTILEALKNLGIDAGAINLEHPADLNNGDYSTNVAMVIFRNVRSEFKSLSKDLSKDETSVYSKESFEKAYNSSKNIKDKLNIYTYRSPFDIANLIKSEIEKNLPKEISKIEVAGAGFINFYLSREFFVDSIKDILNKKENWGKNELSKGKKIMVEYTDPNPFKPFHIGHLMTNAIGESIARVVEFSGAQTVRANYQGDVGLHVAKAIYGLQNFGMPDENLSVSEKAQYIGMQYAKGSDEYDNNPEVKGAIDAINKKIYEKSDDGINKIYAWGREVTLLAFEEIYSLLGTKFNHYFFESIMAPIGEKIVRANTPNVFEESDGAVVFKADKYNPKLHTRVFITSSGLPLYETKEIGLTMTKFEKEENLDLSIVTTAIEQGEYMKVVQQAISLMHPELEKKMKHITHGMMRLSSGKMSSRKGNVVTGESLLQDSMDVVREKVAERDLSQDEKENIAQTVGVAALKYSILRSSLGSDIVYDFEKSISFDGDSGPYLQYTAVRANGIHNKAEGEGICAAYTDIPSDITVLEKTLYRFPEVVAHSYEQLEPHHIATYLTELASAFNSFYGNTVIVNKNDPYAPYRVALVSAFQTTMQNGLYLLGIKTPEKM